MKSKRNQIFLLILVIIIWGVVIFRFFSFTETGDSGLQPINIDSSGQHHAEEQTAYRYYLNYSDPFLKTVRTSPRTAQEVRPVPNRVNFGNPIPPLRFIGIVSSNKKRTGILQFDDQSFMVSEGDELNGFRIKQIGDHSIRVYHVAADSTLEIKKPN